MMSMQILRGLCLSVLLSVAAMAWADEPASVVNVNTADAEMLADVLVGIGLTRAEAIVAYRDVNGRFASIDELASVKGVGEATVRRNRNRIQLD